MAMNNKTYCINAKVALLIIILLNGCSGVETLPSSARAGDTVVIAAGYKQHFERENLTVTIQDSQGATTTYEPGDSAVRAVINLYPDPLSYMITGTHIGEPPDHSYGTVINYSFTDNDPDWWQTTVYLDLPASMAAGQANISLDSSSGESHNVPVNVIPGQGAPATFKAENNGSLTAQQMHSMERRPSYTVRFSGLSAVPAAIELELSHDPDSSVDGTGTPLVVNPRGEKKNIAWTDNGTQMSILILNAGDGTWKEFNLNDYGLKVYKFYITGGITGLQVVYAKAFNQNGDELPGLSVSID